ncbi:hypothetical protein GGF31_003448 [Allomyces arbusculus]|nr:hypothetical protein GGF31_003448 [Allomyces arbusculus]
MEDQASEVDTVRFVHCLRLVNTKLQRKFKSLTRAIHAASKLCLASFLLLGPVPINKDKNLLAPTATVEDTIAPQVLAIDLFHTVLLIAHESESRPTPFWNSRCRNASARLWTPAFVASGDQTHWIRSTLNETPTAIFTGPSQVTPVNDHVEDPTESVKSIKLKVYPTPEQQKTLCKWFGTARYVYNRTLKHIKDSPGIKYSFENLRDQFVPAKVSYKVCQSCGVEVKSNRRKLKCPGCDYDAFDTNTVPNPNIQPWEAETPTSVRAQAINDLVKAYKTCFANKRNGNIKSFNVSFRTKKGDQSIYIEKTLVKFKDRQLFVFPRLLGQLRLGGRTLKKWGNRLDFSKDMRLCWSKGSGYHLCVPMTKTIVPSQPKQSMVALDPGLRKFMTGYSESEYFTVKRDMSKVLKLRAKIVLLQSLRAKHKLSNKTKVAKLFTRLGHLTDDLHWKTITYLTTRYTDILLPSFESQDMMRGFRNRSNNRNFSELKFYLFKCRLVHKAEERGVRVYIVNEAYTSKTCTVCGCINNVAGMEVIKCTQCHTTIDRDVNGARNIYLKHV